MNRQCTHPFIIICVLAITLIFCSIASAATWYVDDSAPAENQTGTIDHPYRTIQQAVAFAQSGDSILVGQGVYYPSYDDPPDQESSIFLVSGVSIQGGYFGWTSLGFSTTRDPGTYTTTLNGDFDNDDILGDFETNRDDNALIVVRVPSGCQKPSGTGANGASLDGCYIVSGHNDRQVAEPLTSVPFELGGGMYIEPGPDTEPVIRACKFTANFSTMGGAVFTEQGSAPTFRLCVFAGNLGGDGGAIAFYAGNEDEEEPQSTRIDLLTCTLTGNDSTALGGAVYGLNWIGDGSAILNVVCCTFDLNVCGIDINKASQGGAIAILGSVGSLVIVNSKFIENEASAEEAEGGAVFFQTSDGTCAIKNCTFTGNVANIGGAVFVSSSNATMTIVDSILWGDVADDDDDDDEIYVDSGTLTVNYSDVMGGWTGPGGNNIDDDPDLDIYHRLTSNSPCRDAGDNNAVAADVLDVDDDTNTGEYAPDRDLLTRILNDVVDMGAFETCLECP